MIRRKISPHFLKLKNSGKNQHELKMFALPLLHVGGAIILYYPLLNFWTLRWGILFVYLIIVLIKERFRIGTLVPVLAEKCSFFKEK